MKASLYDTIMSFPDGLDTIVGEKGVLLSGGQKLEPHSLVTVDRVSIG